MKKRLSLLVFLVTYFIFPGIFVKSATAQVTPDGTTNTTVDAQGNDFTIENGDRAGNNLFHSFQDFSVPNGGSAFFDNAADISNILSRVTGGNISNIDGLIRANGSANLFLINPAGIIFGEGASLDIGGSFYGSTADSILFEDGEFSAVDNLDQPILTINAPIGLSFRDNPGEITNRSVVSSLVENSAGEFEPVGLEVNPGNTLALIGGNINFERGNLTAPGSNIELGGLSEAGTVDINPDDSLSFPDGVTKADINLNNNADVDVRGTGGGSVNVNARNLNLSAGEFDPSAIRAGIRPESTSAEAQAGNIVIDVTDNITADGGSSIINSVEESAVGNAGEINITTTNLKLTEGGQVNASNLNGSGDAGEINIQADGTIEADGERQNVDGFFISSGILSLVQVSAIGNSGGINITTTNLKLTGGAEVNASTLDGSQGDAGEINIQASDTIEADGRGSDGINSGIFSIVDAEGTGNPSGINITTTDLKLTGGAEINTSNFSGQTDAGGINITTDNLELTEGGQVNASTFSQGDGGAISIQANGTIEADGERLDVDGSFISSGILSLATGSAIGNSGEINITTTNLKLTGGAEVNASNLGSGDVGGININADGTIEADGRGEDGFNSGIFSIVDAEGIGNPGGINITTTNLKLTGGAEINTSNFFGQSDGGGINITTDNLELTEGAQINANTSGQGDGGAISIQANGTIEADGERLDVDGISSGIFSLVKESAEGNSGGINITTSRLKLTRGAEINSSNLLSQGGDPGTINIQASDTIEADGRGEDGFNSGIFSLVDAEGIGNSGRITINTANLKLTGGAEINTSTFFGQTDAGGINITTDNLELTEGAQISAEFASTSTGTGGSIELQVAENLILRDNSTISAEASGNANGGNLTIDTNFIVAFPSQEPGNGNDLIAIAENGIGGNINITAESLLGIQERTASDGNGTNDIDASSDFGLDGDISISSPDINVIQTDLESPDNPLESEQTVAQACRSNVESGNKSDLTINGKGGVIPAPDLPLDSQNVLINGNVTNSISAIPQPIETSKGKIQPARGVLVTESGKVILTAYRTSNLDNRLTEIKPNCRNARNLPW